MLKVNKLITTAALLLILVLSYLILKELQSFLIPLFVAWILFFIINPLYNYLISKKIPSFAAIIIIVIMIVGLGYFIGYFVYTSVSMFTAEFPKYEAKLFSIVQYMLQSVGYPQNEINNITKSFNIPELLKQGSLTNLLTTIVSSVLGLAGNAFLIILILIFFILEMDQLRIRIRKAFSEKGKKIDNIIDKTFSEVRKYLIGKTFVAASQGIIFGLILFAFGVDFALLWGFLCFIFDFIPNIGSIVATILPFLTALLQFDNILIPIILLIILVIVQNTISNIIEPKFMGDQLNLSPLMILLSLIFWGYIWGIMGMILAVPILSIIKIILNSVEETKPAAIIISNKEKPDKVKKLFFFKKKQ